MNRTRASLIAFFAGVALLACNAIIGTKDLFYDADGGGSSSGDEGGASSSSSGNTSSSSSSGSSGNEAGTDGATCQGDLQTDKKNCGACGHDCFGGDCKAGKCQPVQLVTTGSPRYVATDATNIYYTDDALDQVRKMPKSGGSPQTLCVSPGKLTQEIAIDATNVYFTFSNLADGGEMGGVAQCALTGGTASVISPDQYYASTFVLDTGTLYWATAGNPQPIVSMKLGAPPAAKIGAGDPGADITIRVFGNSLYIANDTSNGTLKRCTLPQCTGSETLSTNADGIDAVSVKNANLVWGTGVYPGTLYQGQLDGGNPQGFSVGPPIPHTFVFDDKYLYWCNAGPHNAQTDSYDQGSIMRCPHTNGFVTCDATGPVTLSTTPQSYVHGLISDTDSIYWVETGTLWRLAK
jgi:hypothetical protein